MFAESLTLINGGTPVEDSLISWQPFVANQEPSPQDVDAFKLLCQLWENESPLFLKNNILNIYTHLKIYIFLHFFSDTLDPRKFSNI
jgi:hypothetical protein